MFDVCSNLFAAITNLTGKVGVVSIIKQTGTGIILPSNTSINLVLQEHQIDLKQQIIQELYTSWQTSLSHTPQ